MGELTVFECDVEGDRYGAKNDVFTIGVKRRSASNPFRIFEYDVHVGVEAEIPDGIRPAQLQHINWVGIEKGQILGASTGSNDEVNYRERGDVVLDRHESLFRWLETEVIR